MITGQVLLRRFATPLLLLAGLALSGCQDSGDTGGSPLPPTDLRPIGQAFTDVPVIRVVDGDTLHVLLEGDDVTVRLIGMDTPETVKPDFPVECFGPEASEFAKEALSNRRVTVELDASQGVTDRYGRTLAYVWVPQPDGGLSLFNREAIAAGYAQERQYGSTPYAWKAEFSEAQRAAQRADVGMWANCS